MGAMNMKRFARARRDVASCDATGGFTIIEVVIALSLFMIIFTGVMTFTQSNLVTGTRAKARAKAINAAASYLEYVRSLPYESIGIVGGTGTTPSGVLAAQDQVQNGLTLHVVPDVTWINDPKINGAGGVTTLTDYKRVTITVTASWGSQSALSPTTYTLGSVLSRVGGTATATPLPTIDFDSSSPLQNLYYSGTVHVGAVAQPQASGATITNLNMYADDSQKGLLISPSDEVAQWPPQSWGSTTFQWNTQAVDASSVPVFQDGPHNLTLQVFDSLGKSAFVVRPMYVINNPPSVPVVTLVAASSTTLTASWGVCMTTAGSIPAARYEWQIYDENNSSGVWQQQESPMTGFTTSTVVAIAKPVRWDRYKILVRSYTPTATNNAAVFVSNWGVGYGLTRPVLTGLLCSNSYVGNPTKKWTTIVGTPTADWTPYFLSSAPTVQYYRNSTMSTSTATTVASFPDSFTTSANNNGIAPTQYWYTAKLTGNLTGSVGGAPTGPYTVWSNWVGPNTFKSGSNTSTGTLTFSGW